jgi:hypothetical protein
MRKYILKIMLVICIFLNMKDSQLLSQNYNIEGKNLNILEGSLLGCQGFFSVFLMSLGALDVYDKNPETGLWINLNNGLYYKATQGPNWWEYYFAPVLFVPSYNWTLHTYDIHEITHLALGALFEMSRKRGYELIKKYIHVKPEILNEVDSFISSHFCDSYVIGIHYRGTDKVELELDRLSFEDAVLAIEKEIEAIPSNKKNDFCLFVATDEATFLEYIKNKFKCRVIYTNATRSHNGSGVHWQHPDNYLKGKEALLDCLLLSRCHCLLHTESNLSLIAEYFNPYIPSHLLKTCWRVHGWEELSKKRPG